MSEQRERRRLWVEALRSGEFEQAYGCLRSGGDGFYCCLGVACEVYRRETGNGLWDFDLVSPRGVPFVLDHSDETSKLPQDVMEWYGLTDPGGMFHGPYGSQSLWQLNDLEHMTFEQIAELVEDEPDGLVVG